MRKNSFALAFIVFLFSAVVSSCQKDKANIVGADPALIGKWKLNANYFSSGGPGSWQVVGVDDSHILTFNTDGTLGGNAMPLFNNYAIKDSLLNFSYGGNNITLEAYAIKNDTLFMSPRGSVVCIEGCAVRYIKQ